MKRIRMLIILAVVVGFVSTMAIGEAKAAPVKLLIGVGARAVVTGTAGSTYVGLGVAAVAPLILTSPYWYQFYKHPECRKEPTIADLSNCVQYGPAKK